MDVARETWIDTAKGAAIVMVVGYHAALFLGAVDLDGPWAYVTVPLDTLRMPLFFSMAGVFAAKSMQWGFAELWRNRIAGWLWLYFLWSLLTVLFFQVTPWPPVAGEPNWLLLAASPVWPSANTWFFYALAVYFTVMWLARNFPVPAQLAPAVVLSVAFGTGWIQTGNAALDKIAIYFIFFAGAVHFGPRFREVAPRVATLKLSCVVAVTWVGLTVATLGVGAMNIPGVRLALSALALVMGVTGAILADRTALFGWLTILGRRTLPVYLLHFFPVLTVAALMEGRASGFVPGLIFTPVLTAVSIAVALAVYRLAHRLPGVFSLPERLNKRPTAV